ncbi:MAG: segregation and condensation protein A [Caulobacteraceae bacterium]
MNAIPASMDFEAAALASEDGEALIIDIDGFEGPLHLLLALARKQKVDLLKLSVLKLADQYLEFVRQAQRRHFALAADYLVMAAWLAYLKSRLLLPSARPRPGDEPEAEDMAARLAFALAKLDAMRKAGEALQNGPILNRTVFVRGDPDAVKINPSVRLEGDLYALMDAFAGQAKRTMKRDYRPRPPAAYPLEEARERLRELTPRLKDWTPLQTVAPLADGAGAGPSRASFLASTLSASLELVKEGALEARQLADFDPVYLRRRKLEGVA